MSLIGELVRRNLQVCGRWLSKTPQELVFGGNLKVPECKGPRSSVIIYIINSFYRGPVEAEGGVMMDNSMLGAFQEHICSNCNRCSGEDRLKNINVRYEKSCYIMDCPVLNEADKKEQEEATQSA